MDGSGRGRPRGRPKVSGQQSGDSGPTDDQAALEKRRRAAKRRTRNKSAFHRREDQRKVASKREQLCKAVEYCKNYNCRGYSALATGIFPLVKDARTINKYLDKKLDPFASSEYCSILTVEEEKLLVKMFQMKARAYQPFNRKQATKYVVSILKLRQSVNKSIGGRKFKKLSPAALKVIETGSLTRNFWERFDAKYAKELAKKRKGLTSLKRVQACSLKMAKDHIDSLADELISTGIMTDWEKIESGKWKGVIDGNRVFNHDETPQFLNYGVDGTARNIYYCGKGEKCSGLITENRECATISPMISLAGEVAICHVIFASACITGNMAPDSTVKSIDNLLVSNTENGFQTGKSCRAFYKELDKYLTKNNIRRPVVTLTDGHSSRFDIPVLKFCEDKQIFQFVSPPDTTGLLQPLDQINSVLHTAYRDAKEQLVLNSHISREVFMTILGDIWPTWASSETIVKSFKRCGITTAQLDTGLMQQDKFASADLITQDSDDSTSNPVQSPVVVESPRHFKRGSTAYWKAKAHGYEKALKDMIESPIDPAKIPALTTVQKFPKKKKSKNLRITQVYGSLTGHQILEKRLELEKEEEIKNQKRKEKVDKAKEIKEAFQLCQEQCQCNQDICKVKGLRKCSVCGDVLKSMCSKAMCKIAANGKPTMIMPGVDRKKKAVESTKTTGKASKKETVYARYYNSDSESDTIANVEEVQDTDSNEDEKTEAEGFLSEVWESISPPVNERDVVGKWFCGVYEEILIVGRATKRWLHDEDGKVKSLTLDCLKPRSRGSGCLFQSYPAGKPDIYDFNLKDIIGGPLNCRVPEKKPGYWEFPDWDKVVAFYNQIGTLDRADVYKEYLK